MNNDKAQSVRARLLNRSRQNAEDFNTLLGRYVALRFLHRMAVSRHAQSFVLKGAQLFLIWDIDATRSTRDIDLLGFVKRDPSELEATIRNICETDVEPDGIWFDTESIAVTTIRKTHFHGGVRCTLSCRLGTAQQRLQIDIGFGDSIMPMPEWAPIPRLLEDEALREIRVYRIETAIAEKFESMVALGIGNSRLKDFYDVDILLTRLDDNDDALSAALAATFAKRGTALPTATPSALSQSYWSQSIVQRQWLAFGKKNSGKLDPLETVCARIWTRLEPVVRRVIAEIKTSANQESPRSEPPH